MRLRAPALLLTALALLLTLGQPVFAQEGNPAVTDLGNNVYLVDGNQGQIPNLLPAAEVQKIAALQEVAPGVYYPKTSPVSPDDLTVLIFTEGGGSFLNIRDGSRVPLKGINGVVATLSNSFWLDQDTLGLYTLSSSSEIWLVGLDRRTGEGAVLAQSSLEAGVPVFASPNGRRALVATVPGGVQAAAAAGDLVARLPGGDTRPAPQVVRMFPLPPAGTQARELADFAAMFSPLEGAADQLVTSQGFTELAVVDTVTGERRPVLNLPPGAQPVDLSFSQDGSKFALAIEQLPFVRRQGRDGALLSDLLYRDATGNLPPGQNPFLQGNQLITLDFASGELRSLNGKDGDGAIYTGASWSPDNQTLAVVLNHPGRVKGRRYPLYNPQYRSGASLRFYSPALQELRRLEKLELSYKDLKVTFASPDELIIESHYRLDTHPWYYNLRSGELRNIADRAGTFAHAIPTHRSREIVFAYTSYTDPIDFYRMSWDGTAFARLTWFNEGGRQLSQTRQHPVSFTLRDGSAHSGVLILPADAPFPPQRLPIIVWQEGGPTSVLENSWQAYVESPFGLLPNFGFGLLVVPLYGRYGLGPERFNALADGLNYGQIDIDAMNEIVGQLRAKGWASTVGVTGCSYGGYFTTQSVTRHPGTYDAAHAMCSLVDVYAEWSRGFPALAPWMQGLPPQNAVAEYAKDSPAYNADRVRTPLLAFHGTNDFLPITLMENYMLQVINNGVPAKLLKFQDADHGFTGRSNPLALTRAYELYGAQEQLIWFRTYLR